MKELNDVLRPIAEAINKKIDEYGKKMKELRAQELKKSTASICDVCGHALGSEECKCLIKNSPKTPFTDTLGAIKGKKKVNSVALLGNAIPTAPTVAKGEPGYGRKHLESKGQVPAVPRGPAKPAGLVADDAPPVAEIKKGETGCGCTGCGGPVAKNLPRKKMCKSCSSTTKSEDGLIDVKPKGIVPGDKAIKEPNDEPGSGGKTSPNGLNKTFDIWPGKDENSPAKRGAQRGSITAPIKEGGKAHKVPLYNGDVVSGEMSAKMNKAELPAAKPPKMASPITAPVTSKSEDLSKGPPPIPTDAKAKKSPGLGGGTQVLGTPSGSRPPTPAKLPGVTKAEYTMEHKRAAQDRLNTEMSRGTHGAIAGVGDMISIRPIASNPTAPKMTKSVADLKAGALTKSQKKV